MTTQGKQTTAYVLAGLGLAAGIGGIFYASKKGYGGWGKFGMFILFGAPFNIASTALQMSVANDNKIENQPISGLILNCNDGYSTLDIGGCTNHGGVKSKGYHPKNDVVDNGYGGLPSDYCMYNPDDIICQSI